MAAGFASIQSELFFYPNTGMVFGGAEQTLQSLIGRFKESSVSRIFSGKQDQAKQESTKHI